MKFIQYLVSPLPMFLLGGLILILSCEPDLDPDDPGNNPNNPNNPNQPATIDSDKASGYLVLDSATEISGVPGLTADGQIKMDVEDTIFSVKEYPLGRRLEFLHDPSQNVSGFYIYVGDASSYYDVPETIIEGQSTPPEEVDSTSVLVLDLDPPTDEVDYPFTIEIKIQPHDPSGTPLDEFIRWISVEDPEDSRNGGCNSITGKVWEWNFTLNINNGDISHVWAPSLSTPINTTGGGCCNGDGKSLTIVDPGCVADINEPNMKWVQVTPHDYYVRKYEYLQFRDDGSAFADDKEIIKNWDATTTDFCSQTLSYIWTVNENQLVTGTHDFVPGADYMNLNFPDWKGSWRPRGGDIVYTCNVLVLSFRIEGQDTLIKVYKKWDGTQIDYTEVIWHD